MLPPFFYKGVSDQGLFDAYAQVIDAVVADLRVYLDHVPEMSGGPITVSSMEMLVAGFGDEIAALMDSSGDRDNTAAAIAAFPQIDTYSVSVSRIPENAAAGGAGCISASSSVNPKDIWAGIDGPGEPDQKACQWQTSAVRCVLEGLPLIPSIKTAIANQHGDAGFGRVRSPLTETKPTQDQAFFEAVRIAGPQGG